MSSPSMMHARLVSVIVPVYNVEDYLRECIDSIIKQTYSHLEIILVDDGSTDGSGAICDEYASKDNRIRVIHQENKGVSVARNQGLNIATGEFISFIDSDDRIDLQTIAGYMDLFALHPELDIIESVIYDCITKPLCQFGENFEEPGISGRVLNAKEFWLLLAVEFSNSAYPGPANKCYRRSFIGDLRFPEGYVFEDLAFLLCLYGKLRYYMKWSKVTYFYREDRPGSITERDPNLVIPKLRDSYENMKSIILDLEKARDNGVRYSEGMISIDEHIKYVASYFMSNILYPPYGDYRETRIRKLYQKIQAPYVEFLKSRPYESFYPNRIRARNIAIWNYSFYMNIYVALLVKYATIYSLLFRRDKSKSA